MGVKRNKGYKKYSWWYNDDIKYYQLNKKTYIYIVHYIYIQYKATDLVRICCMARQYLNIS